MNILTNQIFIFTSSSIIIKNDNFINGFIDFFELLISHNKIIYIISDVKNITLNSFFNKPDILSKIIIINHDKQCYLNIIKENIHKFNLWEFVSFITNINEIMWYDYVTYNTVLISDDDQTKSFKHTIQNYLNIQHLNINVSLKHIPFYISSKTKYAYEWQNSLRNFPFCSEWIYCNKTKEEMTTEDKILLCSSIYNDIQKVSFGIMFCKSEDKDHIGSLIELGLLLSKNIPIFLCGDDKYVNEVLFQFGSLINFKYVNQYDIVKIVYDIYYNMDDDYMLCKTKFTTL